jgi:hypothetical protein
MCRIDAGNLREILNPLPIQKLYGVGRKTLPTAKRPLDHFGSEK